MEFMHRQHIYQAKYLCKYTLDNIRLFNWFIQRIHFYSCIHLYRSDGHELNLVYLSFLKYISCFYLVNMYWSILLIVDSHAIRYKALDEITFMSLDEKANTFLTSNTYHLFISFGSTIVLSIFLVLKATLI